ncbi:MAG TPA: hypothetical protein VFA45_01110 [Actinomycetes bacterium]|jgi:SAM-dependent methyltransferase|nr:hypothetical protein [Actinomycetes bacterium]
MKPRQPAGPGSRGGPAGRPGPATANRPGPADYDAELRLHNEALRRACDIRRHDHVLDVGCGTGQTTREAARTATAGGAVDPLAADRALERLRETLAAHASRDGIWFDSRAWIVAARRR